jgi:phage tail-like protein
MASVSFREPYRTHGFAIEIEGTSVPITKVTGLSEGAADTIEVIEGGSTFARKISSGVVKFDTLVIERNVDGSEHDTLFRNWFRDIFRIHGSSGSSSVRRNGAVIKYENGQEVLRFAFYDAWIKSSKFSDLEAGSTNIFKQTVELEHNGLERIV